MEYHVRSAIFSTTIQWFDIVGCVLLAAVFHCTFVNFSIGIRIGWANASMVTYAWVCTIVRPQIQFILRVDLVELSAKSIIKLRCACSAFAHVPCPIYYHFGYSSIQSGSQSICIGFNNISSGLPSNYYLLYAIWRIITIIFEAISIESSHWAGFCCFRNWFTNINVICTRVRVDQCK